MDVADILVDKIMKMEDNPKDQVGMFKEWCKLTADTHNIDPEDESDIFLFNNKNRTAILIIEDSEIRLGIGKYNRKKEHMMPTLNITRRI